MRWSFYTIYNLPFKLDFKDVQTSTGLFQPETSCEFKILALQWGVRRKAFQNAGRRQSWLKSQRWEKWGICAWALNNVLPAKCVLKFWHFLSGSLRKLYRPFSSVLLGEVQLGEVQHGVTARNFTRSVLLALVHCVQTDAVSLLNSYKSFP